MLACTAGQGCTPFGGWLYDDPSFAFSEVTFRGPGGVPDTLELVLTACNLNDYPVEAHTVELVLMLDGSRLGEARFEQAFMLQSRNTTKLSVALPLPPGTDTLAHRRKFLLSGYTTVQTPMGPRRVELNQSGDFSLAPRNEVALVNSRARPCRPGHSTLPSYMPPVHLLPPPPIEPPSRQGP